MRMTVYGCLFVKCKTCGEWFASGIAQGPFEPNNLALNGNTHVCPRGHAHKYSGVDYADEKALKK